MSMGSPSSLFLMLILAATALLLIVLDVSPTPLFRIGSDQLEPSAPLVEDVNLGSKHTDSSRTCRSMEEYAVYSPRKSLSFNASASLRSKIREYEALHARCVVGPDECLESCSYVIFITMGQGLGNKMIALTATFLYALLTDRVLLISRKENMDLLFCEPFPSSSWLLPESWTHLEAAPYTGSWIGSLVGSLNCTRDVSFPETNLFNTFGDEDKSFFCQKQQESLRVQSKWIVVAANQYFAPALYNVPMFKDKLQQWFPQQEAIFHLLGRYLLHPSDPVWSMTTRYFDSYLARADLVVGIQLRQHIWFDPPNLADVVFDCLVNQSILSNVTEPGRQRRQRTSSTALLIVSLNPQFSKTIRAKVLSYDQLDGSSVSVHQPSDEATQHTGDQEHDIKAAMEIYLASLSDVLVTSPPSTFGYSAAGLAGVRPVQFLCANDQASAKCAVRGSMEPCYHTYPTEFVLANHEICECDLGYRLA